MSDYRIYITAKQGIFNPAGATAAKALEQLGYAGVQEVRVGKFIELSASDDVDEAAVREMCEKLLANPIIEDFRIELAAQSEQPAPPTPVEPRVKQPVQFAQSEQPTQA
jgi:phosphoribosylformylglycinamidine synthase